MSAQLEEKILDPSPFLQPEVKVKPLWPEGPAVVEEPEDLRAVREACPEVKDCEGDLLRLVMNEVDALLGEIDDRVESEVAGHHRMQMIVNGVNAARNQLAMGGRCSRRDLSRIVESALRGSPDLIAAKEEAEALIHKQEDNAVKPLSGRSGIVAAAEDVAADIHAPVSVREPDYASMPPETPVQIFDEQGVLLGVVTAAAMVVLLQNRQALAAGIPTAMDGSRVVIEETSIGQATASNLYKDDADPLHFQKLADEKKAKAEEEKKRRQEALAAAQKEPQAEGWAGQIETEKLLEHETEPGMGGN